MVVRELAVMVPALVIIVLLPALSVNGLVPPDDNVPIPSNPIEVGVMAMVSIDDTPVNAPFCVTFNPVDVNENAPVLLPIVVLLVPVVLILVVPTKVAPAVAVNNPLRVTLSPMFAVSSVVSFLTQ